jgi:hypothetical protein
MPPPSPPGITRILPIQLQIGDRMTDSTGEWGIIGHPYTTNGGKNAHVRVQRADTPSVMETRLWGSYEKVTVIRQHPPRRASDDASASSFRDRRVVLARLGHGGLRPVRVGAVGDQFAHPEAS